MINTQKEAEIFFCKFTSEICGSLCVFGDWFGKPHDNWHRIKSFEVKENYLKLGFDEGETLEVWDWQGLSKEGKGFVVQRATHVRWEWFYYGRPQLPENRFFREHIVKGGNVIASSNVTWYSPIFNPSLSKPAVSLE